MRQQQPTVKSGLDRLVAQRFHPLKGARVGILSAPATVDANLSHILDLALAHGVHVVRLFGAEHGFFGNAQDMEAVGEETTAKNAQIPIVSLYGTDRDSLFLKPDDLKDIDILVCDLPDIGSRYYTFAYTIAFAMQACAVTGTRCMVLDRPNPIGGLRVEGNAVLPEMRSFVGEYPLANRHGLTLGELVMAFQDMHDKRCDLEVVWMEGWSRAMFFSDTGLPWVLPSPNMPTPTTAEVYPGACLFGGTNLSEGRGTTRPFELVGASYIQDPKRFVELAQSQDLPGVVLRPCWFQPTVRKHANLLCGGLQMHITDREAFEPLKTAIAIIWAARQWAGFDWSREPYEFVHDRLAIDLLFGDTKPRMVLEADGNVVDVVATFQEGAQLFARLRNRVLHAGYSK